MQACGTLLSAGAFIDFFFFLKGDAAITANIKASASASRCYRGDMPATRRASVLTLKWVISPLPITNPPEQFDCFERDAFNYDYSSASFSKDCRFPTNPGKWGLLQVLYTESNCKPQPHWWHHIWACAHLANVLFNTQLKRALTM